MLPHNHTIYNDLRSTLRPYRRPHKRMQCRSLFQNICQSRNPSLSALFSGSNRTA